ncbi:MAG: outer membrane beta-barrel protein [bacterium]
MRSTKKLIFTANILLLSSKAFCSGLYFGAAVGQSHSQDAGSASDLIWFIYTNINTESSDTKDTAFSAYFGYEFDFNEMCVGVEAGWIDFGENTLYAEGQDFSPGGDGKRTANITAEADAITVSAQLKKAVVNDLSLFGRIGLSSWDVSCTLYGETYNALGDKTGSIFDSGSESGTDLYFGIGLEYKFIRVEFDRYKINETDTDYVSIGIKF